MITVPSWFRCPALHILHQHPCTLPLCVQLPLLLSSTVTSSRHRCVPVQGTLRGFDQATNLILAGCQERVFSIKSGVEVLNLGLYLIRGDNV